MYFITRFACAIAAGVVLFGGLEVVAQQTTAPEIGPLAPAKNRRAPNTSGTAANNTIVKPFQQPPAPFLLTEQERKRLDKILTYWEHRSGDVKTFSCRFVCRTYDPVFGPKDPNVPFTVSEGILRYAAPDKGEFQIGTTKSYRPPAEPDGKPSYAVQPNVNVEHWVCDGKSVFEMDHKNEQLIETKLPPNLQGLRITDGPLPFMFGAKKEKMLARYWLREIKPPNNQAGQYWLEAMPKTQSDRANFQQVTVILDEKEFLPVALLVYPPNHDPLRNPARKSYQFHQRKVDDVIHQTREFFNQFISPQTPIGWKKVVENLGGPNALQRPVTAAKSPPKQAQGPERQTKR